MHNRFIAVNSCVNVHTFVRTQKNARLLIVYKRLTVWKLDVYGEESFAVNFNVKAIFNVE